MRRARALLMAAVLSVAAGAAVGQDHVEGAYTLAPIIPENQDENSELLEAASDAICNIFVSGVDLDQLMRLLEGYFGDGVVLEEAYPTYGARIHS